MYGIVRQHGGFVTVDSDRGQGSVFFVYLPAFVGEAAADEVPEAGEGIVGGTETILVVEDDAAVRRLVSVLLRRRGYEVIEAADGQEAVEQYREHADRVRLVILDAIMPRMNGKEAAEQIRRIESGVRTLFMSGYAEDVLTTQGVLDAFINFLPKPVTPSVLIRKVRQILDS